MSPTGVLITFLCTISLLQLVSVVHCKKSSNENSNDNVLDKSKSHCTEKALRKIGLQMTKVIGFGPNGRPFADTQDKLKSYCKDTFTMLSQVETFVKSCFKKEVIHLATVYLFSVRNTYNRRLCGKNMKKAAPLVSDAACINEHYYQNDKCIAAFMNQTAQLVTLDDDKLKIPHTCCNNVKLMTCLNKLIDSQSCLAPHRDRLLGVIQGVTSGVSDIACGEYTDSSDRCDRLGPAPKSAKPNKKQYHALVLVLIDLLISMKSFALPN